MYMLDKNQAHSSSFYSTTLKNFATPWTNRDQTVFAPLNDYTATVIGIVRDDVDFRTSLSADLVYVGQGVSPAYSPANNDHYVALEDNNADLRVVLQGTTQSSLNGLPPAATAGSSLRAPRPKRSSSTARTARCSASRCSIICATTWSRCTTRRVRRIASART